MEGEKNKQSFQKCGKKKGNKIMNETKDKRREVI